MKRLLRLLILLPFLPGAFLFAMEGNFDEEIELTSKKTWLATQDKSQPEELSSALNLFKISPEKVGSVKPIQTYQKSGHEKPNEKIKFEFWYKASPSDMPKNSSVYVKVKGFLGWSSWITLSVGDRIYSTQKIKKLCYAYEEDKLDQNCYKFAGNSKVYVRLNKREFGRQTGTTRVGFGGPLAVTSKLLKTSGIAPGARGRLLKTESGLSTLGNIENEQIKPYEEKKVQKENIGVSSVVQEDGNDDYKVTLEKIVTKEGKEESILSVYFKDNDSLFFTIRSIKLFTLRPDNTLNIFFEDEQGKIISEVIDLWQMYKDKRD